MIGKFYAIKDEKSINTGTVISTLFAIVISGGCYFLGGFGRLFDSAEIYNAETGAVVYDSIIPSMLSKLPDILIGIVVVLDQCQHFHPCNIQFNDDTGSVERQYHEKDE